jgi:hypothetical protein
MEGLSIGEREKIGQLGLPDYDSPWWGGGVFRHVCHVTKLLEFFISHIDSKTCFATFFNLIKAMIVIYRNFQKITKCKNIM